MKSSADPAQCVGAIDIGGTKIACGLVDAAGHIMARTAFATCPEDGPARAAQTVIHHLNAWQAQRGARVSAVGVGCTGPVNPRAGLIGHVPFLPGWDGFPLADTLRQALGCPVCLENDADAAALGEARFGAGQGCRSFILLTLGTGIGGGIVLDGRLYRGADGTHPEVGHMILEADGPACSCGARGCWEAWCGGQGFADWVQARHSRPVPLSAGQIFEQAAQNDPLYAAAVHTFSRYLGIGLANLMTLFAPERIALAGGLMGSSHLFLEAARREIEQRCRLVPPQTTGLVSAQLGADAGLIGAAAVCLFQQDATP